MKGEAKKTEEGLVVKFEDIANVKDALKEGIALCMQGECECETEAYQHVEKIEMLEDEDSISGFSISGSEYILAISASI